MLTLEKSAVWLSDPHSFPDMFDATIPMKNMEYLYSEYSFYCTWELAYKALQIMADEDGEPTIDKESFFKGIYQTMQEYDTQEKIEEKLLEIMGEGEYDEYRKMRGEQMPTIDFSKPVKRTRRLLSELTSVPRDSLARKVFYGEKRREIGEIPNECVVAEFDSDQRNGLPQGLIDDAV